MLSFWTEAEINPLQYTGPGGLYIGKYLPGEAKYQSMSHTGKIRDGEEKKKENVGEKEERDKKRKWKVKG
jgi:hypothetical protein